MGQRGSSSQVTDKQKDDDETFLEFIKYPPDFVDKKNKTRKYSYNDGIVYVFDTYGEMLDARYKKDLQI